MDEIFARFPHIGEQIYTELDDQTLTRCRQVCDSWRTFLDNEKLLWVRSILSYIEPHNSCQWKNFMKKNPASILAEIEHGVRQFYTKYPFKIEGMSPMHFAAMYGNICALKSLINDSAISSDYPRNARRRTPLHYAAMDGQLEACKLLLQKYGNINPKDEDNYTPLFWAASNGHFDVYQFIMEQCEEKNPRNGKEGYTPLHGAATSGNTQLCKFIMDKVGYQKAKCLERGLTPFHLAASFGHFAICELMIHNLDDINPKDNLGATPLSLAACYGHLRVCKLLYENMSSNLDNEEWCELLIIAARGQKGSDGGDYDVCKFFANEVRNKYLDNVDSILYVAAQTGNLKICKLLVENLNIIPKSKYFQYSNQTSLHAAAKKGHFEVYKVIMKSFKNVNPRDEEGNTPLHLAAKIGHFHLCELILSNVKCKNPRNNFDKLPIDYAEENNHRPIIHLFRNPLALKRPRQFDIADTKPKKVKLNERESLKATQKKLGIIVASKHLMPLEIESFTIDVILVETRKHAGNLNEISTAIGKKLRNQYGGNWSAAVVKRGQLTDYGYSITTIAGSQINLTYDGHNYTVFKTA
jgi:ankyrin repeat protein